MASSGTVLMPSGYDPFAYGNNIFTDEEIATWLFNEMTAFPSDDEGNVSLSWPGYRPNSGTSPCLPATEGPRSPPSRNIPGSADGHSLSPSDVPLIYTPNSSIHDPGGVDGSDSDVVSSTSPRSSLSAIDDFVHVGLQNGAPTVGQYGMMDQLQQPRQARRAASSPRAIEPSRQPELVSNHRQQEQQQLQPPNSFQLQWHASSFSSGHSNGMDPRTGSQFASYIPTDDLTSFNNMANDLISNVGAFDTSYPASGYPAQVLPIRQPFDHASILPSPYGHHTPVTQPIPPVRPHNPPVSNNINYIHQDMCQNNNTPNNIPTVTPTAPQSGLFSQYHAHQQYLQAMAQANLYVGPLYNDHRVPDTASIPHRPAEHPMSDDDADSDRVASNRNKIRPQLGDIVDASAAADALRVRRQSNATRPSAGSSTKRSDPGGVRKGGRVKGEHLPEKTRKKTTLLRKIGACWRCALQRDPCDHGDPCTRCMMQSQRGQTYFFDCDRSKLPDFVHDFLPPSMTYMHQKQSIEDIVASEVRQWDLSNSIDILLHCGYGPPLRWRVYEFEPRTGELLSQLQYITQDQQTAPTMTYSPPYGLLKIDTSDETHMENYLDELLDPSHLWDFAWSFYEEECMTDTENFQAGVLDLLCKLYMTTTDETLKPLLRLIVRLQLVTYIMGHTLTLAPSTLPALLSNVQHTRTPHSTSLPEYTSPRLANRQLKFFFSVLRLTLYTKLLKWLQQTLHTAGSKSTTFLPSFLVMLGFAMSLEEAQRTIIIQADAKFRRGGADSWEEVDTEAKNACERIDERFRLLVGLFQCKYRDKKWEVDGDFGPGTPRVDGVGGEFLRELRMLVVERENHLRSREKVPFAAANQCLYTTRLTARFLLPFLGLPKT